MITQYIYKLTLCILVIFCGCRSPKEPIITDENPEIISVQNTPEILLVNLSIDSRDSVKLINSLKNSGRLRGELPSKSEPKEGDLIISFLDNLNTICHQSIIDNPLIRRVEYSESDDISTLKSQTFKLDSAEFFVRVQYDACFQHLKIERFTEEKIVELGHFRYFIQLL